jgi:hypothetical protein
MHLSNLIQNGSTGTMLRSLHARRPPASTDTVDNGNDYNIVTLGDHSKITHNADPAGSRQHV